MHRKEFSHDDLQRVIAKEYKNICGIVVMKDDSLIYENYFNGYGKEDTIHVASVTKSILSALIGIAIDKGFIGSINQKVLDFFPEYDGTLADSKKQEVTIKHLLTMTAPYIYKREPFKELCLSPDWAKYALDLLGGNDECGTFKYSTAGAHLLSVILTKATGKTAREFANEYLLAPTGMKQLPEYEMTAATYMNFIKGRNVFGWVSDPKGYSTGGWGVTLSAGDMARFGQLYLNCGKWNGHQIISRKWIEESLQDNPNHYGYLWWLFNEDEFAYCAMGDGGNVICCLPERNMVVVIASKFMMRPKDRMKLIKDYILLKEDFTMEKQSMEGAKTPSQLIDEKIEELGDWRGQMLSKVRDLIRQVDPEVVEAWKFRGTPAWYHDGMICTGETYKNAVKLTFAKGASLKDPLHLFNSSLDGNTRRAIDFHEGDEVDEEAFKDLIRAAIALNRSI